MDINSAREQVGGDEDAADTLAEGLHDHGAVVHLQVCVDNAYSEPVGAHVVSQ